MLAMRVGPIVAWLANRRIRAVQGADATTAPCGWPLNSTTALTDQWANDKRQCA